MDQRSPTRRAPIPMQPTQAPAAGVGAFGAFLGGNIMLVFAILIFFGVLATWYFLVYSPAQDKKRRKHIRDSDSDDSDSSESDSEDDRKRLKKTAPKGDKTPV